MRYDTHTVNAVGIISVRMVKDGGGFHRCIFVPNDDLTGQPQEVIDAAKEAWTQEVIDAYQASIAEPVVELTLAEQEEVVKQQRAQAYRDELDPMFFQVQRGERKQQEYDDKVKEIRNRYPWPDGSTR